MDQHQYQHPGQPYQQQRAKRPVWRIVLGVVLLVLGALALLGTLASLATGNFESTEGGAETFGALLGALCCVGVPFIAGVLLVALPGRRA